MTAPTHKFFVGGEQRSSEHQQPVLNPWDGSKVGTVAVASSSDLEAAVAKGLCGFEKTRALASFEREQILSYVSGRIHAQREEFARLITAETGKPIRFSRIEVERAVTTFRLAAEEAKRIEGDTIPLDLASDSKDRFGIVRRFPIGIVACVTPFNFPLNLVAHKVAPAIASGNAFILKPAPQAPLTALRLCSIIDESGLPREAWSVLPCPNDVTEELVCHEHVAMVSFTGSAAVGWKLKGMAGRKKILLELGGNAGAIVHADADIETAASKNVVGSFGSSGQVCIKVQRIFVHERVYESYLELFLKKTRSLKCGNPSDSDTTVGPLIDEMAIERIESWVTEAVKKGAQVLTGGKRVGKVFEPTVLANVDRSSKVFCEEVFGPVVVIERFADFGEAISGINDSRYGLQAAIFSNDFRGILRAFRELSVGAVIVNENPTYRIDHMPYGGIKESGFGREGVRYAIREMTEPKMLVVHSN